MITIKNEFISCSVSETSAEIKSLKKGETEYIWCADPAFWGKSAPILFPAIGSTKDNKYVLDGKTYEMNKHGFLYGKEFTVEKQSETSVTLLRTHDSETLPIFPFEFEFRAIFTLEGCSLKVEYNVTNRSEKTMYFSVGAHEAYSAPGGVEDYDIIFPNKEDLETVLLEGPLVTDTTATVAKNSEFFSVYEKYFALDTLIFRRLKSKEVLLKNRKTERTVKVEYPDCDYLAFWHAPGAEYLCIEPWSALPDNVNSDYDITKKEGITALPAYGVYNNTHIITI